MKTATKGKKLRIVTELTLLCNAPTRQAKVKNIGGRATGSNSGVFMPCEGNGWGLLS